MVETYRRLRNTTITMNGISEISVRLIICILVIGTLPNLFKIDNDNYFQLVHAGIIQNHGFVTHDMLSMHNDMSFMVPQWLFSIVISFFYNLSGSVGINLFCYAVAFATVYVIYRICYLISKNKTQSMILASLFYLFEYIFLYSPRPHLVSLLILSIEVLIFEHYRAGNDKYLPFLPLLSMLLINFHNSLWILQYIFMLPYLAEILIQNKRMFTPKLCVCVVLTAFAGLLNPYGYNAIVYIKNSFASVNELAIPVSEMKPLGADFSTIFYLCPYALPVTIYACQMTSKKAPLSHLLLCGGTFIMAILFVRNVIQAYLGMIPLLATISADFHFKTHEEKLSTANSIKKSIACVLYALVFAYPSISAQCSSMQFYKFIDYMQENVPKDAVIFNTLNQGASLAYYGYKPYIDTRIEAYGIANAKTFDYLKEYNEMATYGVALDEKLRKYNFDVFVISEFQAPALSKKLRDSDEYEVVYDDGFSMIAERATDQNSQQK